VQVQRPAAAAKQFQGAPAIWGTKLPWEKQMNASPWVSPWGRFLSVPDPRWCCTSVHAGVCVLLGKY